MKQEQKMQMTQRIYFFGKIIKIDKPLDKLTKEGKNRN